MTDPRETLARIRAQADATTDGPWEADGLEGTITSKTDGLVTDPQGHYMVVDGITMWAEADAEFIAAARTTVPALTDALDAVLKLHVRAECPTCGSRDGEGNEFHKCDEDAYCEECDLEGYPCPTVEAITTALEGEPHD